MSDPRDVAEPSVTFPWRLRLSDALALFSSALVILGGVAWAGSFVDNAKAQDRRITALELQVQQLQVDTRDRLARIETKVDLLTGSDRQRGAAK